MKKLLSILLLALTGTLTINAQNWFSESFLLHRALNTGTNGWGVTNLSALYTNAGMILNPTNVTYTNSSGTYVGTATAYLANVGTTNADTTRSIFRDVPINGGVDRSGRPIVTQILEYGVGLPTNNTYLSSCNIYIEYVNPLGSNAPMGVVFRPVWTADNSPTASNADDWGFRIAGLATGKGSLSTNVPLWKWPGAKALRVVAATNQFILAGPNGQTNSPFITKLLLDGYAP